MMWLTWRQHRFEAVIALAFFGLFASFMVPTGLNIATAYHQLGIASCLANTSTPRCADAVSTFWQRAGATGIVGWANFLPLIFGTLLAAPFVMDLESGTYRFAWTQSVTRNRWTLTKMGLLVAGCILIGGAFALLMSWWRIPLDHLEGSMNPNDAFDFEGIVPIAYTLFAVALVVTLGTVLHRIVPAIGISLVAYLVVRLGTQNVLRPHYMTPLTKITPASGGEGNSPFTVGRWIISTGLSDAQGRDLSGTSLSQLCGNAMQSTAKGTQGQRGALDACLQSHHIFDYVTYQPADRFWAFQGIESAIFLGISALLLAVAVWWIRYRVA